MIHFTEKQNNVQAFVNLHICPIIIFCWQYFLQEVSARLYFLVNSQQEKSAFIFQMIRAFTFRFCYQYTCCLWWLLTDCLTGTFWLTDRDAGIKC